MTALIIIGVIILFALVCYGQYLEKFGAMDETRRLRRDLKRRDQSPR